jgi:hypothetical protein
MQIPDLYVILFFFLFCGAMELCQERVRRVQPPGLPDEEAELAELTPEAFDRWSRELTLSSEMFREIGGPIAEELADQQQAFAEYMAGYSSLIATWRPPSSVAVPKQPPAIQAVAVPSFRPEQPPDNQGDAPKGTGVAYCKICHRFLGQTGGESFGYVKVADSYHQAEFDYQTNRFRVTCEKDSANGLIGAYEITMEELKNGHS